MECGDPFRRIDTLIRHDVPFVIVGGHAVTYHGYIPGYPNEAVGDLLSSARDSDGREFVSLKWMKKMKQAAGRPKDRIGLDNLPDE